MWGGYEILGKACLETGQKERALAAYLKETELRSDPELTFKVAELYFLEKDYEQAARWYEKIPSSFLHYPRARVYLAGCYARNKDYPRAEALYRECAETFPEYSQICFFNLARISLWEGADAKAQSWLEKISDSGIREKIVSDDSFKRLLE